MTTSTITLPCGPNDPLDWKEPILVAKSLIAEGHSILWYLDCGLSEGELTLREEFVWNAIDLAIRRFTEVVLPDFQTTSIGACLYKGDADIADRFVWQPQDADFFEEFMQEHRMGDKAGKVLFSWNVFAEYLQRILVLLPDTMAVFAHFDLEVGLDPEMVPIIFSKERFPHIVLNLKTTLSENSALAEPISLGIALPQDVRMSEEMLKKISDIEKVLSSEKILFRVIPEAELHLEWEGIETLIYFSENIDRIGKRGIMGFNAGGGTLIYADAPLGFDEETDLQSWLERDRSRGIRTPDLLLPKQPR